MKVENNSLESFQGWGQEESNEDFFKDLDEISAGESSFEEGLTQPEDTQQGEEDQEEDGEGATPIEEDMFQASEQGDAEPEPGEGEDFENTLSTVKTLNFLKEKGFIDFESEEELTEETANEVLEDSFAAAVESRVEDLFDGLPDSVKQLNNYVLKGGDLNSFIDNLINTSKGGIQDGMDIEDENSQETIVREMMRKDGNDEELIETQIEFLKDSGKLGMFARKNYEKWKEERKQQHKALVEKQARIEKEIRQNLRESKRRMKEVLSKSKDLGGIPVNKEIKDSIPEYAVDRTVKLQNGSYISQMQKELYYDLPQNETAYLQLAALMRNRNEDGTFNFNNIKEAVQTEITGKVRDGVRRVDNSIPTNSKNRSFKQTNKSLADFFNK